MKRAVLAIFITLFVTNGCATHYYKSGKNDLYFYLKKPEANSVHFLCSIDGYKSHQAKLVDSNMWEVKVPLQKEFRYFYVVDGEPFIPDCQLMEADDFGSKNCIFVSLL